MAARANARPAAGHVCLALDVPTVTVDHGNVEQQRRGRETPPLDPRRILSEADLETALASLPDLSSDAARAAYRKLSRRSPPPAFSRDLLIRALAYRLQVHLAVTMPASLPALDLEDCVQSAWGRRDTINAP
jgi:hypothetical protein